MVVRKAIIIIVLLAIVGAVVLVSGCLGVTMNTTVNANGKITDVSTELNMSESSYSMFASLVQMSGEDMKTYMVQNYSKEYGGPGTVVDYNERHANGYVYMTLDAHGSDVQPLEGSNVSVTKDGDYWVYRYLTTGAESTSGIPTDTSSLSSSMADMVTMDFYLTMPGKIIDSNADKVNGNKAEWHMNANTMNSKSSLYAKSESKASSPGFEAAFALLALAGGVGLIALRKKE